MERDCLWLIPAAPLVTSALCGAIALARSHRGGEPPRRLVGLIACLGPTVSFALALLAWVELRGLMPAGRVLSQTLYRWLDVGALQLDIGFVIDPLSSLMLLFVTGVGTLIHVYSTGYMHEDKSYARYFAYLNLFLFFMLMLVLGRSLLVLFVGWEGVGLCSYLLIGFFYDRPFDERTGLSCADAGRKAFLVNRIGTLDKLAREGLGQRLLSLREKKDFGGKEPKYRARLEEELTVIKSMGYAGYFLIVADFIRFAKNRGIPVGPGRGSAAGSLVAYSLNIHRPRSDRI